MILAGVCLAQLGVSQGAVIFSTNFSEAQGYSVGGLAGHPQWTVGEGDPNVYWIAEPNSDKPQAPTSLSSGLHPSSLSGGNLLWISSKTSDVLADRTALLAFSSQDNLIAEDFVFSFNWMASPTGGSGQATTMHLGRNGASSGPGIPQIRFSSSNTSSMTFAVRDGGTWITLSTNPNPLDPGSSLLISKDTWLRIEISVRWEAKTYGVTIYELDSNGEVSNTIVHVPDDALHYTLSQGFNTFRFLTNSSRMDYWVDSITVSAIPEPATTALITAAMVFLAGWILRRKVAKSR